MRNDKQIAINLRKKGNSYSQIKNKLNIPKSTLSYWLKDVKISKKAKNKISKRVSSTSVLALINRNKAQTNIAKARAQNIINNAKTEVAELLTNKLFIAGVSLYWAEGYKKGAYGSKWKCVDFANSDPEMIKVAMNFFRKICHVNNTNFKIQIITHKNVNISESINYWSEVTRLPAKQFIKTSSIINKSSNNKRFNTLQYGTIHIRIYNTDLFHKIIGWIEGLKCYFNK